MNPVVAELVGWAEVAFPDLSWRGSELRSGAFHDVLLGNDGVVARVAHGDHHASRSARERSQLQAVGGLELGLQLPRVLSGPVTHSSRTGHVVSRVAGGGLAPSTWGDVRTSYQTILAALAAAPTDLDLPPPRTWCGAADLRAIVADDLSPFLADRTPAAVELVDQVLALPPPAAPTFVHGDFGQHNILWEGGRAVSLIDFDHACVGDPAIDIAPLIGAHGAGAVGEITDGQVLARAMVHRATLPLQVASAAHLAGKQQLRDHALRNFVQRHETGTLHDPGGATP